MIRGTPEDDFFEMNNAFRYITEVKALIDAFDEYRAGRLMWAIWLFCHPSSEIFEADDQDKIEWIKLNYLNLPEFVWPERKIVAKKKPKKESKRGRKDEDFDEDDIDGLEYEGNGDDDELDLDKIKITVGYKDKDLEVKYVVDNIEFYNAMEAFPSYAMSIEELDYYRLVRLRNLAAQRSEYLNGKDMAAAIKQLASSSPDLDKMKARYLSWKEEQTRTGGEVQSGGASKRIKR